MKTAKETKKVDFATWSAGELAGEVKKLRMEIAKAVLGRRSGKDKNLRAVFNLRKRLARALTVLQNKKLENSAKND